MLFPDFISHLRRLPVQRAFWSFIIFSLTAPSLWINARTSLPATALLNGRALSATQETDEARYLEARDTVERELAGGERHAYRIALTAGQFMRVVVEQRGINVVLTLLAPDGSRLAEVDKSLINAGTESLFQVAELPGDYRLEVRAWDKEAVLGRYEVRFVELREATTQDRTRAAAQKIVDEARHLSTQGLLTDLLRKRIGKLELALPLWRAAADTEREAETLESLGGAYHRLEEYQKAREYYEQALTLWRAAGDRAGQARALQILGSVYGFSYEREKELDCYNQALALHRAAGDKQGEVSMLARFGWLYWGLEEFQKSLDYFGQALTLSQSMGYRQGEASGLYGLGLLYWGLGEYQKSLEAYSKSLPRWRAAGSKHWETATLDNMGLVYHALGEYQKALECYAQSLPYRRETGLRSLEADTLTGIGTVYASLGENQKALEYLNQALPLYREARNRTGETYAHRNIGYVYISLKELPQAIDHLNHAVALARVLGERNSEARALAGLARAGRDRGDLVEARAHIEAALDIIESFRSKLASQELRASFFASKRSYYEFYIDLLMRLDAQKPGAGHDAAALRASERARARSLLDLLAEAGVDVSADIDPALRKREGEIQSRISRLNSETIQALSLHAPDKERIARLKEELKQTDSEYEQLEVEVRKRHPKYAEMKYPTPLTPATIQGMLGERTALLEYTLGQDSSFLFVVSREGLQSYRLPPGAEINRLVEEVRHAISQPGRREFGRYFGAAQKLYEVLVAPAANALKEKQTLLIAPDAALYYLPFEVLLTAQQTGTSPKQQRELPFLLKRWAVGYVPSASVLSSLRQSRPELERRMDGQSRKEFVAFADPVYALQARGGAAAEVNKTVERVRNLFDYEGRLDLQRLKDSGREVNGISKSFKPLEAVTYVGAQASEENVKVSEYIRNARRLHFAAHGLISERAPQYSGLVLTLDTDAREDGLLQVYEIFNLKLSADLVVLSACRTGIGKEVHGEGVIGLTRAFLYAGASSVAVSLWQVADQSTAELMIQFYEQMKQANNKAEALRVAKLKMIEEGRYAHPYYWAPFVLIGEPQ
jgi:CHAT domain-containing protein